MCPIAPRDVEGPDFAAADSNIEWAAVRAEARILALRQALTYYQGAVHACEEDVASDSAGG